MNFRAIAAAAVAIASIGFGAGTAQAAQIPTGQSHNVHAHPSNRVAVQAWRQQITGPTYKVHKGDTLWRIAVRSYGGAGGGEHAGHQWVRIAKANHLHSTRIQVGQVIAIPR